MKPIILTVVGLYTFALLAYLVTKFIDNRTEEGITERDAIINNIENE